MRKLIGLVALSLLAGCASRQFQPGMTTDILPGQTMSISAAAPSSPTSPTTPTAHIENRGPGLVTIRQEDGSMEFRIGAPGAAEVPIKKSIRVRNDSGEKADVTVKVTGSDQTKIVCPDATAK